MRLPQPKIIVVILNWNQPDDTLMCIDSVFRSEYQNYDVVVVDNHSKDNSVAQIQAIYPDLTIIVNECNLGYAAGNNSGIRYALKNGADYILLLNNDALVEPDTLRQMAKPMTDPSVGAVGSKVYFLDHPDILWAAGECFPYGEYPRDDGQFELQGPLKYAVGCCLLMRSKIIEDVGMLAPEFFLIHEEKDWCYRVRETGYRVIYSPKAIVRHKVTFTASFTPTYHYLAVRNQLLLLKRHDGLPSGLGWLYTAITICQVELDFIRKHGDNRWRRTLGMLRGVYDYARGRFGAPPENL